MRFGNRFERAGRAPLLLLFLLAAAALLLHGYHPLAEDGEIYVSAVVKILHPADYPFGAQFFEANAHLTVFPRLVAWSVRLSHLPLAWVLLLWQFACLFLLLLACWRIASKCFPSASGRWGAVILVAALLTMPVAETDLYLLDQYFNPRSLAAFAVLFAADALLDRRYGLAALWLALTALVHPQMAVFAAVYLVLISLAGKVRLAPEPSLSLFFFPAFLVAHPSPAYLTCLAGHPDFFLFRWHWYGWVGALAPLLLLAQFSRMARRRDRPPLERLAWSAVLLGVVFLLAAIVISVSPGLITLVRYQPMRSLFLEYLFLLLFSGGFLGELVLQAKPLRWLLLFVPLCAGMAYAQVRLFPASLHVEWPGSAPRNPWTRAFLWIRANTPANAVFALDPDFMDIRGEDHQGFRAAAERSRLADAVKDWSDSTLYPQLPLADVCQAEVEAARGWKNFTRADFERLHRAFGLTWVVLQQPGVPGFDCPYRNSAVLVCRLDSAPVLPAHDPAARAAPDETLSPRLGK